MIGRKKLSTPFRQFDWQPRILSKLCTHPFSSRSLMPWPAKGAHDIQRLKHKRDRRYQSKSEVKEKKREKDRLYQQRKREHARLRQHEDPLAQLANITTQQQYLEAVDNPIDESMIIVPMIDGEEPIDVGGTVEEDGEVLENF